MTSSIFCSQSHLMLDSTTCPICGWARPVSGSAGIPLWGPLSLNAELGSPGRGSYISMEASGDLFLVPLANGGLAGIRQSAGMEQWRKTFEPGFHLRGLAPDGARVLGALCDERSLMEAGYGKLVSINPDTGEMQSVWQADSHSISLPVISDRYIFLRSSSNQFFALTRESSPQIGWQKKLQSWLPLPPLVTDGLVIICDGQAMQNSFFLVAYDTETGQETWREAIKSLLSNPPVSVNHKLVYVDDRDHAITAREATTGKLLWRKEFNRVYSNLTAQNGIIFFTNRGNNDPSAPDHYQLTALRADDGREAWRINLPVRVSRLTYLEPNILLLASDKARLLAVDTAPRQILWDYNLSSEDDPLRTDLLVSQGVLIAGTYSGRLTAIQVAEPTAVPADAEAALREGHIREGAEALALRGEFERSARLFIDPLGEPEKAIALFAYGNLPAKAAKLAFDLGQHDRALKFYRDAGDRQGQAVCLEKMGSEIEAATLWLDLGDDLRAAGLFEKGGEPVKAWEIYRRVGRTTDADRLADHLPADLRSIETLENNGLFTEAAQLAMKANLYERAVRLFQKAEDKDGEYSALLEMNRVAPEEWSLTRQIEVSRSSGKFGDEAEAWSRLNHLLESSGRKPLDNYENAGNAHRRAAQQTEAREGANHEKIARIYESAAEWFAKAYKDTEYQICREKVIIYRRLPEITLTGRADKEFRETEFNEIELQITNKGAGVATKIQLDFDESRFEVDCPAAGKHIDHLNVGDTICVRPSLCPRSGQRGYVPFMVKYSWKDIQGNLYGNSTNIQVGVKRLVESGSGSSVPQTVIYQGTVYTSQGEMNIAGRDTIQGNKVEGDLLENGAQKGDRVEIIHGSNSSHRVNSANATGSTKEETRPCVRCSLPVSQTEKFCTACGESSPWNKD